jgi:hypothetical protein
MMRSARIAAATIALVLLAGTATAIAAFTKTASAAQTVSSRNLGAPTGLTGTPSGHNVNLSWTAGTNGNGYAIAAAANGTSSNCTAASFSALTTTAGTSITDTGRFTPQGTFECYRVTTTYGTWSSQTGNPTVAVRLGVVAQAVAVANGGTAGRFDQGDTIVITFNQAITTASGPVAANNVCTNTGGTVMLGVTGTGGTCSTATATTIGTLTSLTINRAARYDATYAWSAGNTVLTVTIGSRSAGAQDPTISGTAVYTPTTTATGLLSATGSFHTCSSNSGGGNCTPSATGSF